ncbi:MAG: DUF3685 domain-containing protein [Coleofasciculus sp. S288]|nr:DUF3685 domain-containing protein [Coleofasciculus sp. S288]
MSDRIIHLLLIDDDPIFRLGLRAALEPFPDLQVVAEVDTSVAALEVLRDLQRQESVDLVVLELALGRSNLDQSRRNVEAGASEVATPAPSETTLQPATPLLTGVQLCQQLKAQFPNLPLLLLTAQTDATQLAAAKAAGVEGYCPKGCAIALIVAAMRQVLAGESAWQMLPTQTSQVRAPSWHHKLRFSGLQQIEDELARVTRQLQNPNLSNLDWLFWSGRRRELLAARWVVNQLLPTDVVVLEREDRRAGEWGSWRIGESEDRRSSPPQSLNPSVPYSSSLTPGRPASLTPPYPLTSSLPHQFTPFEATRAKLQSSLSNLTGIVLEIDILQDEKKRDLLQIILQKFQDILDDLRFSQVTLDQLLQKRSLILHDLWEASLTDFFGKYYTLPVGNQEFEVVNVLLSNALIVQYFILDKIPLVMELLAHQLFEMPLTIDNVPYPARTPEALARAEILLQNLVIQAANAVIQPLLNEFADIETIKQTFFDRRLISSREVARFRNNLSWRYRVFQLLDEPRSIFESRYNLFVLSNTGIKQTSIYASRRQELEQLRGIQLVVTLAYEARDAIAPRLRGVVAWGGKGVVYVLTQVLGRAIGLIVRGVLQGIGSTLQDTRFGKTGERGKKFYD